MPVTCVELRSFAAGLAVPGAPETALRASVSRSYYALFHNVLPIADRLPKADKHERPDGRVGHSAVRERLLEWHAGADHERLRNKAKTLAISFEACRKQRLIADYELANTVTLAQARKHCAAVQGAMVSCNQLKSEMARKESA